MWDWGIVAGHLRLGMGTVIGRDEVAFKSCNVDAQSDVCTIMNHSEPNHAYGPLPVITDLVDYLQYV